MLETYGGANTLYRTETEITKKGDVESLAKKKKWGINEEIETFVCMCVFNSQPIDHLLLFLGVKNTPRVFPQPPKPNFVRNNKGFFSA